MFGEEKFLWQQKKLSCVLPLQYLHGGSFLNQMLPIVESGFKASTSEARIASYRAWKTLIDSFALKRGTGTSFVIPALLCICSRISLEHKKHLSCPIRQALHRCFSLSAIIQDAKRIKLIMQVFRVTSVKDERVAVEKLRVWWHYVLTLKPTTPAVFEQASAAAPC